MKTCGLLLGLVLVLGACAKAEAPTQAPKALPELKPKPYKIFITPSHIIKQSPDVLFEHPDQWKQLAAGITGYKYYSVQGDTPPPWANKLTLAPFVHFMRERKLEIAAEFGSFGFNGGVEEGRLAAERAIARHQRLYELGGRLDSLHLDGPIRRLLKGAHPSKSTCQLSLEESAREVAIFCKEFHKVHPETKIGLITNFPNWDYTPELRGVVGGFTRGSGVTYREALLATLKAVEAAGEHLDFLEVDCPFSYYKATHVHKGTAPVDNKTKFLALQRLCYEHNLKFYVIVNEDVNPVPENLRAKIFHDGTLAYVHRLRQAGIFPDGFLLQSWYKAPTQNLPETQPYTFTWTALKAVQAIKTLFPGHVVHPRD